MSHSARYEKLNDRKLRQTAQRRGYSGRAISRTGRIKCALVFDNKCEQLVVSDRRGKGNFHDVAVIPATTETPRQKSERNQKAWFVDGCS